MTPSYPRYVPFHEATRIAGPSRSTLYEWAGAGFIRVIKIGNRARVDIESVLAYMETLPVAKIAPAPKRKSAA